MTKQKMEMTNNEIQFNISCHVTNIQIILPIFVFGSSIFLCTLLAASYLAPSKVAHFSLFLFYVLCVYLLSIFRQFIMVAILFSLPSFYLANEIVSFVYFLLSLFFGTVYSVHSIIFVGENCHFNVYYLNTMKNKYCKCTFQYLIDNCFAMCSI